MPKEKKPKTKDNNINKQKKNLTPPKQNASVENMSDPSLGIGKTSSSSNKDVAIKAINDNKKVMVWYSAITLIAVAVLIIGAIQPTVSTIFSILKKIEQKEITYDQLDNKINTLSSLQSQYQNSVHDDLQNLSLIYPTRGDFSLITINLDKICERNNFKMNSISLDSLNSNYEGSNTELQFMQPWQINLVVEGYSNNLISLIEDIENTPMFAEVLSLSYGTEQTENGKLQFSISIKVYKINEPDFYEN